MTIALGQEATAAEAPPAIERLILAYDGSEPDATTFSDGLIISDDGRHVGFGSVATNLTNPTDTNPLVDYFVLDRDTGITEKIVLPTTAGEFVGDNRGTMTPDGRFVLMTTTASNVWAGDTNGVRDVFWLDRQTGVVRLVSVAPGGGLGNGESYGAALSDDGRFVVFHSDASDLVAGDTNGYKDSFLRDVVLGTTVRVSQTSIGEQGNQNTYAQGVSNDGRYVTMTSTASNLASDDTSTDNDVFQKDMQTGEIILVSETSALSPYTGDAWHQSASSDGRFTFYIHSSRGIVYDRLTDTRELATVALGGADSYAWRGSMSDDGRYVVFDSNEQDIVAGDTNLDRDVFMRDLQTDTTVRVSVNASGGQIYDISHGAIVSRNGNYVAFATSGCVFADVPEGPADGLYLWDRTATSEPFELDYDCDGHVDIMDNCPSWPNPEQDQPPWLAPEGDGDCDGFADSVEITLGTAEHDGCGFAPYTFGPSPVWPPDTVASNTVNISDVLALKPYFGGSVPPTPARLDLVPGSGISISDVLALKPVFGQSCAPVGYPAG